MSLQPLITPLMDFSVAGVSVPELATLTADGRVFIASVRYEHRGNVFDATLLFSIDAGTLDVSTQGQAVSMPISQLLGSLLAKINGGAHHGAQTH